MNPRPREFIGFFSYAHHDEKTDPELIEALTVDLENRVNAKLVNARFQIWRDKTKLRTGTLWSDAIATEVSSSDILLVLLTPRWIESEWCRRELDTFELTEATHGFEYVAPLMARDISRQSHHLTQDQRATLKRLERRQYATIGATDFLKLPKHDRASIIDKVADDLEGMIERLRQSPENDRRREGPKNNPSRIQREFRGSPHNYADVDLIGSADVILRPGQNNRRDIYAQIDFIERLYVQGEHGRIEFGVRRAYLTVETDGVGNIYRNTRSISKASSGNAYYVNLQGAKPDSFTICIDPPSNKSSLSELALPIHDGENRYSHIGTADLSVRSDNMYAEVSVSLTPTDLFLVGDRFNSFTAATRSKIEAIMTIAASKTQSSVNESRIKRNVDVSEDVA